MQNFDEDALRRGYNVKSLADLGLGDVRKPQPLFHDFLLQRALIMVGGEPYTGKTMFTLAMAIALDANLPLLGFEPQERQRTLFMGQDAPTWDYAEQTRKLLCGYNLGQAEITSLGSDVCLNEGYNLLDKDFISFLQQWHEDVGFDVLVLDTLASLHAADENSNREMSMVMNVLKRIRDKLGVTVVFTHHESKPSDAQRSAVYRARGASVISGSVDIYISLQSQSDGRVRLTMPKGRGISNHKRRVIYEMGDCGTPDRPGVVLTPVADNAAHLATVLQVLKAGGDTSRADITTFLAKAFPALGPAQVGPAVDNALLALGRTGKAVKVGRGTWRAL